MCTKDRASNLLEQIVESTTKLSSACALPILIVSAAWKIPDKAGNVKCLVWTVMVLGALYFLVQFLSAISNLADHMSYSMTNQMIGGAILLAVVIFWWASASVVLVYFSQTLEVPF